MKNQKTLRRPVGGIYRDSPSDPTVAGLPWILNWPSEFRVPPDIASESSPLGYTCYKTLKAAFAAARKNKLVPRRWAGCDRE
jgi:hypothetical protein